MGPRRAWHRRWVPAAPAALRAGSGPSSVTGGLHRGSRAAAGGGDGENQGETAGAALRSPGHRKRSLQENRPGGPGAAPGRHRGCGAHGGSAPPPSRRGSFGLSPALGRGTCVCWGKKRKKNYTHAQKMRFLCAGARRGHGVGAGELEEVSEPPRHPPASPLLRTGPDRTAPGLRGGQAGVAGGCHHPGEKLRRSQLPGRRGRVRPAGGCARRGAGRYLWRRAAFICI